MCVYRVCFSLLRLSEKWSQNEQMSVMCDLASCLWSPLPLGLGKDEARCSLGTRQTQFTTCTCVFLPHGGWVFLGTRPVCLLQPIGDAGQVRMLPGNQVLTFWDHAELQTVSFLNLTVKTSQSPLFLFSDKITNHFQRPMHLILGCLVSLALSCWLQLPALANLVVIMLRRLGSSHSCGRPGLSSQHLSSAPAIAHIWGVS